jgi:hypothetical protein
MCLSEFTCGLTAAGFFIAAKAGIMTAMDNTNLIR